ncbi:MAG: hypothetical protein JRI68_31550, partial [Deltaproteobacteria bacterium]|nr:hypothetical protein [Deltaproteobacteria bacterium]
MTWKTCSFFLALALPFVGCTDEPPLPQHVESFKLTFVGQNDLGSFDKPLPIPVGTFADFTIDIEAQRHGQPDPTFEGWVVLDVLPSGGWGRVNPSTVKLTGGKRRNFKIGVSAFKTVRIVATDVGYVEAADPANSKCQNGIDDDGDGYVDVPGTAKPGGIQYGDRGCAMISDDSEEGGTGAAGASEPI